MLEILDQVDRQLFLLLNGHYSRAGDSFWFLVTGTITWAPLYALVLAAFVQHFKFDALWVIFGAILVVTLCDQLTATWMKPTFGRLRPCHDPAIAALAHVVGGCGGQYGFASSHAANTFGIAVFTANIMRYHSRWWRIGYLWAAMVSYSRVKVGVHYPGDILAGAVLGILIGWLVFFLLSEIYFRSTIRPLA